MSLWKTWIPVYLLIQVGPVMHIRVVLKVHKIWNLDINLAYKSGYWRWFIESQEVLQFHMLSVPNTSVYLVHCQTFWLWLRERKHQFVVLSVSFISLQFMLVRCGIHIRSGCCWYVNSIKSRISLCLRNIQSTLNFVVPCWRNFIRHKVLLSCTFNLLEWMSQWW